MFYKYLTVLILFSSMLMAQTQESNNSIDSLKLEFKYNHLFNDGGRAMPILTLNNIVDPYSVEFETDILDYSEGNISSLNSMALKHIQKDMAQSFVVFRKGQNKYHLGVVSDILGYVSSAAAVGLAAYHVVKYKKKYGIK
jgi:hypothetical protein